MFDHGETGTGKQLAAEAVHRLSARSESRSSPSTAGPLTRTCCSIPSSGMCGGFHRGQVRPQGRVPGSRPGDPVLDEIQVASRACSRPCSGDRRAQIKPLGSDRETDVDVRLIVASNIDLREAIQRGQFREDLYFRLKVITIHTCRCASRKRISGAGRHFLKLQERLAGRAGMGLSKGRSPS